MIEESDKRLTDKLEVLKKIIGRYKRPCIAFSGGVDSSLLLRAAVEVLGDAVVPITVNGAMMPRSEFKEAADFAKALGAKQQIIDVDVFSISEFVENNSERCYYCKKNIFTQIKGLAQEMGCDVIFDGSNMDDLSDYRPGLRALEEMMVVSPFIEAEMKKADIRGVSLRYGLKTANKPAMACLATRIPTNEEITKRKLHLVEQGEECLKLLDLKQYRLRCIGQLAKIECATEDFDTIMANRNTLSDNLRAIGFKNVTLDLQGYQCGSMNEVKE